MNAYSRLVGSSKRVPAKHFADGGAVTFGARGLAGLRDAIPKIQAMGYPQAGPAPAAPAPGPRSAEALKAMIPRMESMGYQQASGQAPQYFRSGGHVQGPGTGTSDSIPARLSDGEFVLPADTVRKVGVSALERLVADTHKPVKRGGKPGHFADGGYYDSAVDQMRRDTEARKQAGLAAGQAAMAETQALGERMAAERAAARPSPTPDTPVPSTPAPAPASSTADSLRGPGAGGGGGGGGGGGAGGPATPSLESRVSQIPDAGNPTPPAADRQDSMFDNEIGRNVLNTMRALPGVGGIGRVAASGGAISNGLNAMSRLVGTTAAVGAGAAAAPALASAAADTPQIESTPLSKPAANPTAERSAVGDTVYFNSPQSSQVTRTGNSYSGGDVGGNISIGGDGPRGGGISAQNMSAAERLAGDSQSASMRRLGLDQGASARAGGPGSGPVEPGSFTGGFTGVIGSSDTYGNMRGRSPEQQRRDAEVSASSIMNTRRWGGPDAGNSASMQGLRDAVQQVSDIRQNEAGAAREAMRQSGETARARLTGQRYDAANQLDARRLALQETTAGFQNRQAGRLERAQEDFANATTPQAQATARERLMGLTGQRDSDWRLQVTPAVKNADGSTTEGTAFRVNQRTGAVEPVNMGRSTGATVTSQAQYDALPKGATYTGADGKTYRKPA